MWSCSGDKADTHTNDEPPEKKELIHDPPKVLKYSDTTHEDENTTSSDKKAGASRYLDNEEHADMSTGCTKCHSHEKGEHLFDRENLPAFLSANCTDCNMGGTATVVKNVELSCTSN